MKLKKIIPIGLAAIMAVSAMSISTFAANIKNVDDVDFYNTVQILTFNPETQDFDIRYEPASEASLMTLPNYTFTFNQTINTTGSFLTNLKDGSESYLITDDDTMVLRLNQKPSVRLKLQVCKNDGTKLGPYREISTSTTVVEMDGLSEYYNLLGSCKVHLQATSGSTNVSGSLSEY